MSTSPGTCTLFGPDAAIGWVGVEGEEQDEVRTTPGVLTWVTGQRGQCPLLKGRNTGGGSGGVAARGHVACWFADMPVCRACVAR